MNASPQVGAPWDSTTFYELKLDLNGDYVADITWRFTFTQPDAKGNQHVTVAQLTGADATSRTAPGTIITPRNAPVGQVLHAPHGIKIFAGKRLDSFFNDINVPLALQAVLIDATPTNPHPNRNPALPLPRYSDFFLNNSVRSVLVEVPAAITGLGQVNCWGTTAIFDQAHPAGVQVQRAGSPVLASGVFLGIHQAINATEPDTDLAGRPANPETDPASGIWGEVRDRVAEVVQARGTFNQGKQGLHPDGLRRVRGRQPAAQRAALHPGHHARPVDPLGRLQERQGSVRAIIGQLHRGDHQRGVQQQAHPARGNHRLLPLPRPAAGLTRRAHTPRRPPADANPRPPGRPPPCSAGRRRGGPRLILRQSIS